jgi:hypothetical protein
VKKIIIVVALMAVLIPAAAFADFQIGAVALLPGVTIGQMDGSTTISANDLAYGLEARLKLWLFQVGASAFYMPSIETLYVFTDAGLSLDIWFLRLGAGIGPTIAADTQGGGSTLMGWNMKATFDINLGNLGIGIIGYTPLYSLSDIGSTLSDYLNNTYLGVTLMFKLF